VRRGSSFLKPACNRGSRALAGCVALILSAAFAAYSNVLVKAYGKKLNRQSWLPGNVFWFDIAASSRHSTRRQSASSSLDTDGRDRVVVPGVVGSVIAFLLYYWLVQNMDVTKSMLIALVTPVVAVILGMIVLNEEFGWRTLAGGAMIISASLDRRAKQTIADPCNPWLKLKLADLRGEIGLDREFDEWCFVGE
jgi:drug/metabolite transporter (DMT)-like permease